MSAKPKKSEEELTTLIMQAIRQHPEWTDVIDVEIIRGASSNWNARFTMGGFKPVPEGAFIVVDELQKQFDLA
jgi:hypothetical protein